MESILGAFGPFGDLWDPFGSLLGTLWGHSGALGPPLGTIFDDFGIMLGPSDCRKGPKGDEERFWDDFLLIV